MGWWWSSSTSRKDEQQIKGLAAGIEQAAQPPPPPPPQAPAKPITRDEIADAELRDFLASLEGGTGDAKTSTSTTLPPAPSSHAHFAPTTSAESNNNAPQSIAPESLYPDTMSCRSAFDYAFFCQSFGGQWVNVYRYGELRSCSEHWENFWLCMKARAYPDEQRKETFRNHYRKKAIKYKTGPSSEDVWDVRTEPLTDAFQADFAALERRMKEEEAAAAVSH
jgi:hypothetical protein